MEEEINFNRFKEETRHKPIKYVWKKADGTKIKEFSTSKFYANKYKGIISMPKFSLSTEIKLYKDGETYTAKTEYGTTEFSVIKGE